MKIQLWSIGKAHESYVREGVEEFTKRLNHYYPAEWKLISSPKSASQLSSHDLKTTEGEIILKLLQRDDVLVLLDERGKQFTSEKLAEFIQSAANKSTKNLVFLIGGAYGVSSELTKRADLIWSFSQLVFPHQLVRLILAEQLYRACTILRNEKYHHS